MPHHRSDLRVVEQARTILTLGGSERLSDDARLAPPPQAMFTHPGRRE